MVSPVSVQLGATELQFHSGPMVFVGDISTITMATISNLTMVFVGDINRTLWFISNLTMVYIQFNYGFHGLYKLT